MKSLESMQGYMNRLYHSQLIETPSPLSPSPYEGEGELIERGAPPLLNTPFVGEGISETPIVGRGVRRV
jgi:hypothetical protein